MATPITWRTVVGPSAADASRPMQLAQQSFNSAFDSLGNLLRERQAVNSQVEADQRDLQKQNYLDALSSAKTPEELQARAALLESQRMQLDPRVRAEVRGADEARLTNLFSQAKAKNEFSDYETKRQYAPVRDKALGLAVQGNKAGALALIEANPGMPDAADIYKAVVGGERDLTRFNWEGQKVDNDLKDSAARRGLIGVQTQGAKLQNQELQRTAADRALMDTVTKRLATEAFNHSQGGGVVSDTEAYKRTIGKLAAEGVPAHILYKAQPAAAALFDSRNLNSPVGRDAAEIEAKKAEQAAKEQYYKENGIAAPGSVEPVRNIKELVSFVGDVTKDPDEVKALNGFLGKYARTQVDLGNGNKIGVPQEVLRAAILESEDNRLYGTRWARDSNRGDNAEAVLKKMMQDPRVITDIAQRYEIDATTVRKRFTDTLNSVSKPEKKK